MSQAGLYVVATPIGNLEDISYRAVRVLSEVDLVAAEDTRHSRVLLNHYGINKPMQSLHEHNEEQMVADILGRVKRGEAVALISDAGTPLISDPGYRLVRAAREAGLPVHSLPGPSAVVAALSIAGLPPDRFVFEGFLPAKTPAREKRLQMLATETSTMVFFESSHRITASLTTMTEVFGPQRQVAVCRELTKKFETVLWGGLAESLQKLLQDKNQTRGEFVIVLAGCKRGKDEDLTKAQHMLTALLEYLPASQAARIAAKLSNVPRRRIYELLEK